MTAATLGPHRRRTEYAVEIRPPVPSEGDGAFEQVTHSTADGDLQRSGAAGDRADGSVTPSAAAFQMEFHADRRLLVVKLLAAAAFVVVGFVVATSGGRLVALLAVAAGFAVWAARDLLAKAPSAFGYALGALDLHLSRSKEIAIVGEPGAERDRPPEVQIATEVRRDGYRHGTAKNVYST
jgi:hypothetical protein